MSHIKASAHFPLNRRFCLLACDFQALSSLFYCPYPLFSASLRSKSRIFGRNYPIWAANNRTAFFRLKAMPMR